MTLPLAAVEHYKAQQRLTTAVLAAARRAWSGMSPTNFDATWPTVRARTLLVVAAGQKRAATDSAAYVSSVLDELGLKAPLAGDVSTNPLLGVSGDGRPLDTLLDGAVVAAKRASGTGLDPMAALASGGSWLDMAAWTLLSDTGRAAETVSIVARPKVAGYVRMLNAPSCSRCVILAGKFFRWNNGFLRHPRCDCRHIPSAESTAGHLTTNPDSYFHSLDRTAQDKAFTPAGAEAIRQGADIGQVVNARRGLAPAAGTVATTTEGATARGQAGRALAGRTRLMPEAILQAANGDRTKALRLLADHGYLS